MHVFHVFEIMRLKQFNKLTRYKSRKGTCKVRNEIETKWNEMKWNEIDWNEMKWNLTETKWNEMKTHWNETKWNENTLKRNEILLKRNLTKAKCFSLQGVYCYCVLGYNSNLIFFTVYCFWIVQASCYL